MEEIDLVGLKPDIRKILLIGQEGAGKTHFIGTMPRPIYIFSFDKGIQTLAGEPGIKAGIFLDDNRFSPKAYAEFKLTFDKFKRGDMKYKGADGKEEPYKTIAVDSITALSKFIYDHEQRLNNTVDKPGGFTVWRNIKTKLQDIVTQSLLMAQYAVFTAIIEPEKDDLTGEVFFKPSCEGGFRDEMGQWMDAVFFLTVDKTTEGEKQYKMLTVGDRRMRAKIRVPRNLVDKISAVETPSFEELTKKLTSK